jgi:hypothetical protein
MLFPLLLFPLLASCLPIAHDAAKIITTADHMFPSGFVLTAHVEKPRTTSIATKKAVAISYLKRSAARYPYPDDFNPYPTTVSPVTVRAGVTAVMPPGNGGRKRTAPFPQPTGKGIRTFPAQGEEVSKRAPKGALRWGLNIMNLLEEDEFGTVILRQKAADAIVGGDVKIGGMGLEAAKRGLEADEADQHKNWLVKREDKGDAGSSEEDEADSSEEDSGIVGEDDGEESGSKAAGKLVEGITEPS